MRNAEDRDVMGRERTQLSGDDGTALAVMAHGGHGCISVTSNVAPKLLSEFQTACLGGDYAKALIYQDRLMPLHRALFLEPNPAGVKYALSIIGKMRDDMRLPMVKVSDPTRIEIRAALVHAGLIN